MPGDPFLSDPSRKRKRPAKSRAPRKEADEEITSESESDSPQDRDIHDGNVSSDEEFQAESAADKRRRLAKQYLQNLKENEITGDDYDAADLDHDNLSKRLQMDVAQNKGHMYKWYGAKMEAQMQEVQPQNTRVGSRNLTGVAVNYPYIYTVSKDMELIKWKAGKNKPCRVKHSKGGPRYANINTKNPSINHHIGPINCVAASSDNRYVVTGGEDGRLIIWSVENLSCLKVIEVRAPVNAMVFRRDSDNLYVACGDLRIRTYSVNQFAQLEVLYGHQDNIADVSALARETCVSVGSRDKTAMFWKIADESRLTFRGGDSSKKVEHHEGSMDTVSMVDEMRFVSGSDNGSLSLWSLYKKKPIFTQRVAHGLIPEQTAEKASAETDASVARRQIPDPQPYWLTAVHAIPYSDVFVTGSYSGEVKLWRLDSEGRSFSCIGSVPMRGCVVKIAAAELKDEKKVVVYVATSKEHRFGRWVKVDGRNALCTVSFSIA